MIESILTGGGSAGLILSLAYAYRQIQAARREKGADPRVAASAAVIDATTANSVLLASLKEEREDNARNAGRIAELETQNALLYEQIRNMRREYEREIADLRSQFNEVSQRLTGLQSRLAADAPDQEC